MSSEHDQIDFLEAARAHVATGHGVPGGNQTEALKWLAEAAACALIDLAQTQRAILAELQPQRLEPRVEHACVALDPDLAAALGICPLCQERKIVRDGRCAQCAGQEYIPEAQRPATVTGEWDPATVALGEGD